MLQNDSEVLAIAQNGLYTAVISDVLDELGYRHQTMHHRLRPLLPDINSCGFAGRARTLRWMEVDYVPDDDPYGLEIEAMDSLRAGDVVIHSTDWSETIAPWGELMTTVAKRNGAVGCICDGQIRDCAKIVAQGFPVYCAGIRPLDSKGRGIVMAYDVPVRCGDVLVRSGDLVIADYDGVVVAPHEVEVAVLSKAREKATKENASRRELREGKTLREVYDKYGVL